MTPAAISGDYCDLKFVKTRKVAQITIEIPIEQAAEFVAAFGAPDPANGIPVALARLQAGKNEPEPTKERKKWDELPCSQQAAIRCGEPAFRRFLNEYVGGSPISTSNHAADVVRDYCKATSRSQFDQTSQSRTLWVSLETEYKSWLTVPV